MQFIKPGININFIGRRKIAFVISLAMILITIASLIYHGGPRLGVDFAGGTVVHINAGVAALVVKNEDIFIAQTGPTAIYAILSNYIRRYPTESPWLDEALEMKRPPVSAAPMAPLCAECSPSGSKKNGCLPHTLQPPLARKAGCLRSCGRITRTVTPITWARSGPLICLYCL